MDISDMGINEDMNIGSVEDYPLLDDDEWVLDELNSELSPAGLEVSVYAGQVMVRVL